MLKGISPLLGPELLSVLCRMGHGDEIVLADAHFPGESCNSLTIRADGIRISGLLNAILPLFELDSYVESPLIMMEAEPGDTLDPKVEKSYRAVITAHISRDPLSKTGAKWEASAPGIPRISRCDFYERAGKAFAVAMTGETAKYGNIILKKGVTPC